MVPVIQLQIGVLFGEPEIFNVILDTSFAGLILHSAQCDLCEGVKLYTAPYQSSLLSHTPSYFTYQNNGLDFQFSSRHLSGFRYQDRICLPTIPQPTPENTFSEDETEPLCIDSFRFVASMIPMGLPAKIDGVLGIGSIAEDAIGDPLVQHLENKRLIGYSAVSMYFGTEFKKQVRIGHMNHDLIKESDEVHWIAQAREFASVQRVIVGRKEVQLGSSLQVKLNPSTPFIIVP